MTWWNPLEVLNFAKSAGFDNHDTKRAATVALVATSGADHWTFDDPTSPAISSRGLWAIPDNAVTRLGRGDQLNPMVSAGTARELFVMAGGQWTWHPVYLADAGALVLRTLDALDLDGLWTAKPERTFVTMALLRQHRYSSPRIVNTMRQYPVEST